MNVLFQFEANIKKKKKETQKKERNSKKLNCCKKILYNAFMIFIAIINYCEFTCLCIVLINIKCDIPYLLFLHIHLSYVPFQRAEL